MKALRWGLAIGLLVACYDAVDPAPTGLVTLKPADSVAVADGVSLDAITAQVDKRLPKSLWNVTFTTTRGTFTVNGTPTATVAADTTGTAIVYLRAPRDSGLATVTGTTDTVALTRTVHYALAAPTQLLLIPSAANVAEVTGTLTITVKLLRDTGFVSPGAILTFSANLGSLAPVGPSDTSDVVTTVYTPPPDSGVIGVATIVAKDSVASVSGTTTVTIVK